MGRRGTDGRVDVRVGGRGRSRRRAGGLIPRRGDAPRVATETRSFADSKVSKIGRREVLGVADALHARVQETNRSRAEHLLDGE